LFFYWRRFEKIKTIGGLIGAIMDLEVFERIWGFGRVKRIKDGNMVT